MKRRFMRTAAAAVVAMTLAAPAVSAAPPDEGCPRGFMLWSVDAEPYKADNRTDEEGNNNGFVCARRLGKGLSKQFGTDLPIFLFTDDTHTTGQR